MSRREIAAKSLSALHSQHAPLFAALGDLTRLNLLGTLVRGEARSITDLTADFRLTRQAVTKHLRVLEDVGLVASQRQGREMRFAFAPEKLEAARTYLDQVSALWDDAMGRLKSFVESDLPASAVESPARPAAAKRSSRGRRRS